MVIHERTGEKQAAGEVRSLEQNKRFHAMCKDLADQLQWAGEYIDKEEWKRLVLAAHYGQKVVPNPFGAGFVVMNCKRSRELLRSGDDGMSDLIDQLFAFGNEHGVKWSDPTVVPLEVYG